MLFWNTNRKREVLRLKKWTKVLPRKHVLFVETAKSLVIETMRANAVTENTVISMVQETF